MLLCGALVAGISSNKSFIVSLCLEASLEAIGASLGPAENSEARLKPSGQQQGARWSGAVGTQCRRPGAARELL